MTIITRMSNTNTQEDDYNDMPSLLCVECGNVWSKGGAAWEKENPSNEMCKCPRDHMIGNKRSAPSEDEYPSKRFAPTRIDRI